MKSIDGASINRQAARPSLLESNVDIVLVDLQDIKALIKLKDSWIYQAVSEGRFPAPVIRENRCTRWRLSDVRAWITSRTETALKPEDVDPRRRAKQIESLTKARAARAAKREHEASASA